MTTEAPATVEEAVVDNAAPIDQTPAPEMVAETEVIETTEAEPVAAPVEAESPPEPPDVASLLSAMSEQELDELPAVKDLLARRTESVRQSTEDRAKREARTLQQQWLSQGEYKADLAAAARIEGEGADARVVIDPDTADRVAAQMLESQTDVAHELVSALISARMGDTKVEAARVDQLIGLADQVKAGRAGVGDFIEAQLDLLRDVDREQYRPELRAEIEKEVRAELQSAQTVTERQTAAEQRGNQSQPTRGVTGSSGKFFTSQADVDRAMNNGEITLNEASEMRRNGTYDQLPWRN